MPQPVDLQTEMARVAAAERIQQIADRLSLAAQQRLAESAEEERLREETQVRQSNESEHRNIERDGRRRNPFSGRRRSKRDEAEGSSASGAKTEKSGTKGEDGRHFDVKI
jgi:hypothetical protein